MRDPMHDAIRPPTAPRARPRWGGRIVAGCLLAGGVACSEAATEPRSATMAAPRLARADAAGAVDITGVWTYHEDATYLIAEYPGDDRLGAKAFRCSSDGVYTFAQTGDAFTGSYDQVGTCTAADGMTFANDFTGVTVTGTVQGRHLNFVTADGCTYEAAVRGATLDTMGGAARCGAVKFGGTYRATFSAAR
jgi:hypothetical protein